jgi:hypothetical protein
MGARIRGTRLTKVSSVQAPLPPITASPPPTGGTSGGGDSRPSTSQGAICAVNHACVEAYFTRLYHAGVVSSPGIPKGHTVVLNDGWQWQYTGFPTWKKLGYIHAFDTRKNPFFSCDMGSGC